MNRLQNGLINPRIAPRASRLNCKNIFFQIRNVSQVGRHLHTKNTKKVKNKAAASLGNHILCYYLSFIFPDNLI
jgi:hypothetical protein